MNQHTANSAIAEPPVHTAAAVSRDRGIDRDAVHESDLVYLRERVKHMRMARGEWLLGTNN